VKNGIRKKGVPQSEPVRQGEGFSLGKTVMAGKEKGKIFTRKVEGGFRKRGQG